ncbi:MAG TPA: GAF domain-containing protein, partial [Bdellovibrionota bacterium]|nr:GAF domain-containing protein [Bdellovibrionota bacterium]
MTDLANVPSVTDLTNLTNLTGPNFNPLTSDDKLQINMNIISEVGHRVLTTLDPEKLYGEVIKMIQEKFSYYSLAYWSYTPGANEVVLKAKAGYSDDILPVGYKLPIDKGVVGWTVRNCKTYICNNAATDPYYFALKPFDYKSEIAAPVEHNNRLLGVFNIEGPDEQAFHESDKLVIETIANFFAISIVNARLHTEVKSFNTVLKQKIDEKTEELRKASDQILEQQRLLKQENRALKEMIHKTEKVEMIGESAVLKSLLAMVDKVAPTDATVLIQ